jgi:hypothetical protein
LVQASYEGFLATLRRAGPDRLRTYPLSPDRRADVIGWVVEAVECNKANKPGLFKAELDLMNATWKFYKLPKGLPSNWGETNREHILMRHSYETVPEEVRSSFVGTEDSPVVRRYYEMLPTEDEWLSGVAAILIRALAGGHHFREVVIDFMQVWKGCQKAHRADRIIRGFWLGGAIANILSDPNDLPKKGSDNWRICCRAHAQAEATDLFLAK